MQMMKIRYVGKSDCFLIEYNGCKYSISKTQPVITVPLDVYNYIQANMGMFSGDIVPYHDDSEELKEETKKTIEDEINEIEDSITPMEDITPVETKKEVPDESKKRRNTRKRGRPSKSSTRNL